MLTALAIRNDKDIDTIKGTVASQGNDIVTMKQDVKVLHLAVFTTPVKDRKASFHHGVCSGNISDIINAPTDDEFDKDDEEEP